MASAAGGNGSLRNHVETSAPRPDYARDPVLSPAVFVLRF
jgi:hypothetical protein